MIDPRTNKEYKYQMKPRFEERMRALLPDKKDFEAFEKIVHTQPKNFIRCNTLKISPEELFGRLEEKWIVSQPYPSHPEIMLVEGSKRSNSTSTDNNSTGDVAKGDPTKSEPKERSDIGEQFSPTQSSFRDLLPGELGNSIEHLLGYYYIQEISSMLPVIALNPQKNELILDAFASPGSKTTQIAAKMQNTGTIIANDLKIGRIKILVSNLEKAGAMNAITSRRDAIALFSRLSKSTFPKFDKILLDVPCSGEGTLRGSPKTFLMWNEKVIKSLSRQQKKFFAFALKCLKKGGTLIYSTCTHAPEENEAIVSFALENFPVKIEKISAHVASGASPIISNRRSEATIGEQFSRADDSLLPLKSRPGITSWQGETYHKDTKHACRIYPQDNDSEGFFVSKFTLLEEIK